MTLGLHEMVALALAFCGGALAIAAAVGLIRLPEPVLRLHAAVALAGVASGLLLVSLALDTPALAWRLSALAALVLLAAPLTAHALMASARTLAPPGEAHRNEDRDP